MLKKPSIVSFPRKRESISCWFYKDWIPDKNFGNDRKRVFQQAVYFWHHNNHGLSKIQDSRPAPIFLYAIYYLTTISMSRWKINELPTPKYFDYLTFLKQCIYNLATSRQTPDEEPIASASFFIHQWIYTEDNTLPDSRQNLTASYILYICCSN